MAHLYSEKENQHWLHTLHARPSSAVIILEDEQERALIVKANYKSHWTFPGGVIDAGETPKQAAVREIKEEVGLTIGIDSVQFGWMVARHSAAVDTYQFIFKARLQPGMADQIILQESEIDDWQLVSKTDVLSDNLNYAKAVGLWARNNTVGYIEQTFGGGV
ncbi:MAG TPA: NUDIX hydrolase [Candidatus Saccharimonadales bacterium]|nr:NUDIX hydrolase [Candidatus Saccharimonadales bacterium]